MRTVNVHEAKTNFSKLLQRVAAGEEITIANRGVPVARLVAAARPRRELGFASETARIADDFDAPLPADILAGFWGEEETEKPKKAKR